MKTKLSLLTVAVVGLGLLTTGSVQAQQSSSSEAQNSTSKPCVEEVARVYVVGNVAQPQGIDFRPNLSLTQALAMAGGLLRDSQIKKIRIFRAKPNETNNEILVVDLNVIKKRRAPDIILQPYDIIEVPSKRTVGHFIGPGFDVCQLPVRVIM